MSDFQFKVIAILLFALLWVTVTGYRVDLSHFNEEREEKVVSPEARREFYVAMTLLVLFAYIFFSIFLSMLSARRTNSIERVMAFNRIMKCMLYLSFSTILSQMLWYWGEPVSSLYLGMFVISAIVMIHLSWMSFAHWYTYHWFIDAPEKPERPEKLDEGESEIAEIEIH